MRGVGMLACEYCTGLNHGEPYKTWLGLAAVTCLVAGVLLLVRALYLRVETDRPSLWLAVAGLSLAVGVPVSVALSAANILPWGAGNRGPVDAYYDYFDWAVVRENAAAQGPASWDASLLVSRDQAHTLMPLLYAAMALSIAIALAALMAARRAEVRASA